jgi:hypothetical protein
VPVLELQGRHLSWVDSIKYLGIIFSLGCTMQADLSDRARKFQCAVCAILRNKLSGYEAVYTELILKKCMPILFYGLGVFNINANMINVLSQVWNMAFRFIYGLRKHDSTRLVLQGSGTMSLKFLFDERMLLFLDSIKRSNNVFLCNLLYWVHMREWYVRLLAKYNLYGVECRRTIRSSVHNMFNEYCDMI